MIFSVCADAHGRIRYVAGCWYPESEKFLVLLYGSERAESSARMVELLRERIEFLDAFYEPRSLEVLIEPMTFNLNELRDGMLRSKAHITNFRLLSLSPEAHTELSAAWRTDGAVTFDCSFQPQICEGTQIKRLYEDVCVNILYAHNPPVAAAATAEPDKRVVNAAAVAAVEASIEESRIKSGLLSDIRNRFDTEWHKIDATKVDTTLFVTENPLMDLFSNNFMEFKTIAPSLRRHEHWRNGIHIEFAISYQDFGVLREMFQSFSVECAPKTCPIRSRFAFEFTFADMQFKFCGVSQVKELALRLQTESKKWLGSCVDELGTVLAKIDSGTLPDYACCEKGYVCCSDDQLRSLTRVLCQNPAFRKIAPSMPSCSEHFTFVISVEDLYEFKKIISYLLRRQQQEQ